LGTGKGGERGGEKWSSWSWAWDRTDWSLNPHTKSHHPK
jgi:hypothetical protein